MPCGHKVQNAGEIVFPGVIALIGSGGPLPDCATTDAARLSAQWVAVTGGEALLSGEAPSSMNALKHGLMSRQDVWELPALDSTLRFPDSEDTSIQKAP